jgi:ribosomal protein L10
MTREEKSKVIKKLTAELAENTNIYMTDASGLNAVETSNLRRACFNARKNSTPMVMERQIWLLVILVGVVKR